MKVMMFIRWIKRNITVNKTSKKGGRGRETVFCIFSLTLALPSSYEREKKGYNICILYALILINVNF